MRISDWSSDVCSSDLARHPVGRPRQVPEIESGGSLSSEGTVARKMEECFVDRQCGGEHRRQSHRTDVAAIGTFGVTGHDPAEPATQYRPARETARLLLCQPTDPADRDARSRFPPPPPD